MARANGFERQNMQDSRLHPTETRCDHAVFEHGGQRYLQISSTGSSDRKTAGTSQTYRRDAESTRAIRRISGEALPELG
ncbi:MAG TPA: hypothetical protein VKB10_01135 [Gaiellaceae bacterium]|nr:hypothetical protein [Gaiellaceae bacterium]